MPASACLCRRLEASPHSQNAARRLLHTQTDNICLESSTPREREREKGRSYALDAANLHTNTLPENCFLGNDSRCYAHLINKSVGRGGGGESLFRRSNTGGGGVAEVFLPTTRVGPRGIIWRKAVTKTPREREREGERGRERERERNNAHATHRVTARVTQKANPIEPSNLGLRRRLRLIRCCCCCWQRQSPP